MRYSEDYLLDLDKCLDFVPDVAKLNNKKVFIAGATGLIGSAISDLILRWNKKYNARVGLILAGRSKERVVKRFSYYSCDEYSFYYFDATKDQPCSVKADYYIFSANNADPNSYVNTPVDIMLANIIGVKCLLDVAKDNNSRVLYISSSEVYGMNVEAPYKEDEYGPINILNSRSCYPNSKRCAEALCVAYKTQFDVDFVIARPGHIYGPMFTTSDSKASAQFARNAKEGKDIVMKSKGSQVRSYCYALDCATGIITILLNGLSGEAYNISNKESNASVSDLADAFAQSVGKSVIYKIPTDREKLGYNQMQSSCLDASKLEAIGWKGHFNLQMGVERTLRDY